MKEIDFELTIGSRLDMEDLVADIGYANYFFIFLTQEDGFDNLRIQIYPPPHKKFWDFRLDEFEEIINRAKKRLWELRKIPE